MQPAKSITIFVFLSLAVLSKLSFAGEDFAALPEPLTLEQALVLAEEMDPTMQQAQAEVELAHADELAAEAQDGINIWLHGRARKVEPSDRAVTRDRDDHLMSLTVSKNLYDFGRSSAYQTAAKTELAGHEYLYLDRARKRRIEIMQRYFDVLRADMEFARDNEAMAEAYVSLDKLRNRHELGSVSDLDILAMENKYQHALYMRSISQQRMRVARAQLAIALNRPGQLPANLVQPELPQLQRELPEYELLLSKAQADNPRLQALRKRAEAAELRLTAAYAGRRPRLSGELEAAEYSRSMGSNDKRRASLYLDIPLYDGGSTNSSIARAQAELYRVRAELAEAERSLQQMVLERWVELSTLRVDYQRSLAQQEFSDMYLDRSRTLYEMEVQADLGDAMVRLTKAQLDELNVRFTTALVWERMDALTGGALQMGEE